VHNHTKKRRHAESLAYVFMCTNQKTLERSTTLKDQLRGSCANWIASVRAEATKKNWRQHASRNVLNSSEKRKERCCTIHQRPVIYPVAIEGLLVILLLGRIPFPSKYPHFYVRFLDLLFQMFVSVTDRALDVRRPVVENTPAEGIKKTSQAPRSIAIRSAPVY